MHKVTAMKTIYSILGLACFAGFVWYYITHGLPHLPLLMGAMYFSILYKLEELKK